MGNVSKLHFGLALSYRGKVVPSPKSRSIYVVSTPSGGFVASVPELRSVADVVADKLSERYLDLSISAMVAPSILSTFYTDSVLKWVEIPNWFNIVAENQKDVKKLFVVAFREMFEKYQLYPSMMIYIDGIDAHVYPVVTINNEYVVPLPLLIDELISMYMVARMLLRNDKVREATLDRIGREYLDKYVSMESFIVRKALEKPLSKVRIINREINAEAGKYLIDAVASLTRLRFLMTNPKADTKTIIVLLDKIERDLNSVAELIGWNPFFNELLPKLSDLITDLSKDLRRGSLSDGTLASLDIVVKQLESLGLAKNVRVDSIRSLREALRATIDCISSILQMFRGIVESGYFATNERLVKRFYATLDEMLENHKYNERYVIYRDDLNRSFIVVGTNKVFARLCAFPYKLFIDIDTRNGTIVIYVNRRDAIEKVVQPFIDLIKRFISVRYSSLRIPPNLVEYKVAACMEFEPSPENVEKLCALLPIAISMFMRLDNFVMSNAVKELHELERRDPEKLLRYVAEAINVSFNSIRNFARSIMIALQKLNPNNFEKWLVTTKDINDLTKEQILQCLEIARSTLKSYLAYAK